MAGDLMSSLGVTRIGDIRGKPPAVVVSNMPVNTRRYTVKNWYLSKYDDLSSGSDTNAFGADLFRETEGLNLSSTSCGSSDCDTDLEDVPDIEETVGVSSWTYTRACEQLGVAPQSAICEGLKKEQLNLAGRHLGPCDLLPLAMALKGNIDLTSVDLSGNAATGSAILEIANALRSNNTIRKINLSDNNLGTLGAAAVAEIMQHNTGITSLDLSHNNFDDEAAKFLETGIEASFRIANLNLSHNNIGDRGGVYIGTGLGRSESVQILDLSWNKLRGLGIVRVIQAIQVNMVTTHVNLAHNGMGFEGSLALKQMLKNGTYVVDLDVSANRINWKCIELIAEGIKVNENLEVLKIGKNQLTTTGCMDIIDAVSSPNCCISLLDLTDQPVTRDFEMIAQAIKHVRDFEYKHGGFVSCHDLLGRRTGFKIDPMAKLAAFLRDRRIRTTDLFKMMNKNRDIEMTVDEFVNGLKKTGIDVTDEDIESIMTRVIPLMYDNEGIDYRTLLDTIKAQWAAERHEKVMKMKRKAITDAYHNTILHPEVPPAQDESRAQIDDVVNKFRSLLRHRSMPLTALPPIGGAAVSTGHALKSGVSNGELGLLHSVSFHLPHDSASKAPGILSMTRPIGAKAKQFGTDVKKKKKKKLRVKVKKRSSKKKMASK